MRSHMSSSFPWLPLVAAVLLQPFAGIAPRPLAMAQERAPRGTVVTTTLFSPALEGNAVGDSATRRARVYLPPSYETSGLRYPVLYYLHGAGGDASSFFNHGGPRTADRLVADDSMKEMIIVGVDGSGGQPPGWGGFLNSELNGNYEDYVTQDLINHIDSEFRTIPERDSRGLFGQSMGGYATSIYAMTHTDVFGAAYSLASGFHSFSRPDSFPDLSGEKVGFPGAPNALSQLKQIEKPSDFQKNYGGLLFAWAGVFSPNLDNAPLRVDYPFDLDTLEVIPEIRDTWYAYDAFLLLEEHADDLSSLRGYGFGVGRSDGNLPANEDFHQALLDRGIEHDYTTFPGGHGGFMSERYETPLTWLSKWLVHYGDFDGSGGLDITDVNLLIGEIAAETHDARFDVTNDDLVDGDDLDVWIKDLKNTWFGDANLDGEFNAIDIVDVLQGGRFSTGQRALWNEGDWNGDSRFDRADVIAALQDGGYGQGPLAAVSAVPEPSGALLLAVALFAGLVSTRHGLPGCRSRKVAM